jgi:hypothetical protein
MPCIDHDVGADGAQLIRIGHHLVDFGEQARIELPGNPAVAPVRCLVDRHHHLGAALHDLFVGQPRQLVIIQARVRLAQFGDPLPPELGVALDGSPGERGVGGAAPENALRRVVGVVEPVELLLPYGLLRRFSGVHHLLDPLLEDQRGRIPPDLHFGICIDQSFYGTFYHGFYLPLCCGVIMVCWIIPWASVRPKK